VGRFTIVSCSIFFATTSGLNIPEVSEISLVSSGCKKRQKLYVNKQNNNYTIRHDMTINYKKYLFLGTEKTPPKSYLSTSQVLTNEKKPLQNRHDMNVNYI
jgi:hypothetical protein